jgi:sec-independent protein translocase protein TatB
MFGLSFTEIVVILILALVLLGPERLPEMARGLGKVMREFRRATDDLKDTFQTEMYRMEETLPKEPAPPAADAPAPGAAPTAGTDAKPAAVPDAAAAQAPGSTAPGAEEK